MRRRRGAPHRRPSAPASRRAGHRARRHSAAGPFRCRDCRRTVRCRAVHHQAVRRRATQAIRCRTAPSGSGRPGDPDFPERNCLPIRIFDSKRPGNPSRAEKTPRNGHETAFWHGSQRFSSPLGMRKGPSPRKHQVAGFLPHANARKPCQNAVSWPETTDFPARAQRRSRSTSRPAFDNRQPKEGSGKPYSSMSMRSILKMTGRVPSLQHAIITCSSLVQPRMIEPPCSAV